MSSPENPPVPPGEPVPPAQPAPAPSPTADVAPAAAPAGPGFRTLLISSLVVAVLAALAGWGIGEAMLDYFKPSEEAASQAYDFRQLNVEQKVANKQNAAVAFGAFGALLALGLGLAAGLSVRAPVRGILGGVIGLILGAAFGVVMSFILVPIHFDVRDPSGTDLLQALKFHAGLWVPLGLAAGLAFGIGRGGGVGNVLRAVVGGVVGAVVGVLAYELIGAIAFVTDRTIDPISASAITRLMARLSVALFTALGAALAVSEARPRAAKTPPAKTPPADAANGLA